jgi:hypothetical protein
MARTKEQEQIAKVSEDFPYREFMSHPAWKVLDKALGELEANDDVEVTTASRYVVGFLIKSLVEKGLTLPHVTRELRIKNGKSGWRHGKSGRKVPA